MKVRKLWKSSKEDREEKGKGKEEDLINAMCHLDIVQIVRCQAPPKKMSGQKHGAIRLNIVHYHLQEGDFTKL